MGRATNFDCCYIYHILKEGIVHYVGSTSNMNSRKSKHKFSCKTENNHAYNLDIYKYIRANGGWDAFEMVPIRKIENISNQTELRIAENDEMKKFTGLKNMRGSYQTHEEKIEKTRKSNLKWLKNNPEKKLELNRKWAAANPEKISESNRKASIKHRESNRVQYNEYHRQYYQKQKELKSDQ